MKILYACSKTFKNFPELQNVLAHYFIHFNDSYKKYEDPYSFVDIYTSVQDFYLKRRFDDMDNFNSIFNFFFKLEKIIGFSSFLIMHRACDTKYVTTSMLLDNLNKFYRGKINTLELVGTDSSDVKIYESVDEKLAAIDFMREGLYLSDIFIILLFMFTFIFFDDFLDPMIALDDPALDSELVETIWEAATWEPADIFFSFIEFLNFIFFNHFFDTFFSHLFCLTFGDTYLRSILLEYNNVYAIGPGYDDLYIYPLTRTSQFWYDDPFIDEEDMDIWSIETETDDWEDLETWGRSYTAGPATFVSDLYYDLTLDIDFIGASEEYGVVIDKKLYKEQVKIAKGFWKVLRNEYFDQHLSELETRQNIVKKVKRLANGINFQNKFHRRALRFFYNSEMDTLTGSPRLNLKRIKFRKGDIQPYSLNMNHRASALYKFYKENFENVPYKDRDFTSRADWLRLSRRRDLMKRYSKDPLFEDFWLSFWAGVRKVKIMGKDEYYIIKEAEELRLKNTSNFEDLLYEIERRNKRLTPYFTALNMLHEDITKLSKRWNENKAWFHYGFYNTLLGDYFICDEERLSDWEQDDIEDLFDWEEDLIEFIFHDLVLEDYMYLEWDSLLSFYDIDDWNFKSVLAYDIDIFDFDPFLGVQFGGQDMFLFTGFDLAGEYIAEYVFFQPLVVFVSLLKLFSASYYKFFITEITDIIVHLEIDLETWYEDTEEETLYYNFDESMATMFAVDPLGMLVYYFDLMYFETVLDLMLASGILPLFLDLGFSFSKFFFTFFDFYYTDFYFYFDISYLIFFDQFFYFYFVFFIMIFFCFKVILYSIGFDWFVYIFYFFVFCWFFKLCLNLNKFYYNKAFKLNFRFFFIYKNFVSLKRFIRRFLNK